MREQTILWLPGWSFGTDMFSGLHAAFPEEVQHVGMSWTNLHDMSDISDRVQTALDQIDGKVLIVGWSLGAIAAIECALTSEQVTRLALFAPTSSFLKRDDYEFGCDERVVRRMQKQLQRNRDKVLADFSAQLFSEEEAGEEASSSLNRPDDSVQSLVAGLNYLMETDLREQVGNLRQKTLLIHGGEDVICPPEASRYMQAEGRGDLTRIELPGAGHAAFMTEQQSVTRELRTFYEGAVT